MNQIFDTLTLNIIRSYQDAYQVAHLLSHQLGYGQQVIMNCIAITRDDFGWVTVTWPCHFDDRRMTDGELAETVLWPERKAINDWVRTWAVTNFEAVEQARIQQRLDHRIWQESGGTREPNNQVNHRTVRQTLAQLGDYVDLDEPAQNASQCAAAAATQPDDLTSQPLWMFQMMYEDGTILPQFMLHAPDETTAFYLCLSYLQSRMLSQDHWVVVRRARMHDLLFLGGIQDQLVRGGESVVPVVLEITPELLNNTDFVPTGYTYPEGAQGDMSLAAAQEPAALPATGGSPEPDEPTEPDKADDWNVDEVEKMLNDLKDTLMWVMDLEYYPGSTRPLFLFHAVDLAVAQAKLALYASRYHTQADTLKVRQAELADSCRLWVRDELLDEQPIWTLKYHYFYAPDHEVAFFNFHAADKRQAEQLACDWASRNQLFPSEVVVRQHTLVSDQLFVDDLAVRLDTLVRVEPKIECALDQPVAVIFGDTDDPIWFETPGKALSELHYYDLVPAIHWKESTGNLWHMRLYVPRPEPLRHRTSRVER